MTKIKKWCALVLSVMLVAAMGIVSVNAADESIEEVGAAAETGITIHYQNSELAQPYVYLWNSLPTNSAMSDSYPGEKMTASAGGWFTYVINDVTAVNMIFTDKNGNQYSPELRRTTGEWW